MLEWIEVTQDIITSVIPLEADHIPYRKGLTPDMNMRTPPHQLLWNRCKTLTAITGYIRTPPLLSSNYCFSFAFYWFCYSTCEYIRRLQDNGQPLQRAGNQLMIKMVERGNRRINIEHKWCKMKECVTQIQSNKLMSIKLSFSMSIQDMLTVWPVIFNIFLYRLLNRT